MRYQLPSSDPKIVIFFGPPGSGKGTQAAVMSATLGIPAISTGDILRRECASGSALGNSVRATLAAGLLVSDDTINEVVARRIAKPDCNEGFILDGYPRTLEQAHFLGDLLQKMDMPEPVVVHLKVTTQDVVDRLTHRLQCSACGKVFRADEGKKKTEQVCDRDGSRLIQRADDNEASIAERIHVYEVTASHVIRFYQMKHEYHRLSGARPPAEVSEHILHVLNREWHQRAIPLEGSIAGAA